MAGGAGWGRAGSCCGRVMSCCTHVASCCTRVLLVSCFTCVVSCCVALFSGLHSVTGYLGLALVFVWAGRTTGNV